MSGRGASWTQRRRLLGAAACCGRPKDDRGCDLLHEPRTGPCTAQALAPCTHRHEIAVHGWFSPMISCLVESYASPVSMARCGAASVGVLRHELGHILGFPHEFLRSTSSVKGDTGSTRRAVTDYDIASVMNYLWYGLSTSDSSVTPVDAAGSMSIYGMSTALMTAVF